MISVNALASSIVERIVSEAEALNIKVSTLPSGARVIDCGVQATGSQRAGKYLAEVCLGGLGQVAFVPLHLAASDSDCGFWLPGISVSVDQPAIACMASQYAGWAIKRGDFVAMGSGPARALARVEKLYEKLDYADAANVAVIALEGRQLPTDDVASYIADQCGVSPAALTLLIAPTASVAGSIQIAARVVETGLHKLLELGFDVRQVVSGFGAAPIAPVSGDDLRAIGRTNDAILYGGRVYYTVRADDDELQSLIDRIPACASRDYGQPFYQLFQRYGDFYKIDPLLFSPAQVIVNNVASGRSYCAGGVNAQVLRGSLLDVQPEEMPA
jgi:methenyltetrahydromethanopterin cyclohydrolase